MIKEYPKIKSKETKNKRKYHFEQFIKVSVQNRGQAMCNIWIIKVFLKQVLFNYVT